MYRFEEAKRAEEIIWLTMQEVWPKGEWPGNAKYTPKIFLDYKYNGPFIVKAVTPTNVIVQLKGDSIAEELYVSQQHALLCSIIIVIAHQLYGWGKQRKWVRRVNNGKELIKGIPWRTTILKVKPLWSTMHWGFSTKENKLGLLQDF